MARSYLPSKVPEIVSIWRKDLSKVSDLPFCVCFYVYFLRRGNFFPRAGLFCQLAVAWSF